MNFANSEFRAFFDMLIFIPLETNDKQYKHACLLNQHIATLFHETLKDKNLGDSKSIGLIGYGYTDYNEGLIIKLLAIGKGDLTQGEFTFESEGFFEKDNFIIKHDDENVEFFIYVNPEHYQHFSEKIKKVHNEYYISDDIEASRYNTYLDFQRDKCYPDIVTVQIDKTYLPIKSCNVKLTGYDLENEIYTGIVIDKLDEEYQINKGDEISFRVVPRLNNKGDVTEFDLINIGSDIDFLNDNMSDVNNTIIFY